MADLFGVAHNDQPPLTPRQSLSEIFNEEPVPLEVFVQDKKYMNNPALSPIQYDAVRHIEQVLNPETYELMVEGFGSYWRPKRFINYATLLYGKGCILPDEEIYDPVKGRWVEVSSLVHSGKVIGTKDHKTSTFNRTPSHPHGVGRCYRVTMKSGRSFKAYSGHEILTVQHLSRNWTKVSHLSKGNKVLTSAQVTVQDTTHLADEIIEVLAFMVTYGVVTPGDSNNSALGSKRAQDYLRSLEIAVGEKLYADQNLLWSELSNIYHEAFAGVTAFLSRYDIKHDEGVLLGIPGILYSLSAENLAYFFQLLSTYAGQFDDMSHWSRKDETLKRTDAPSYLIRFDVGSQSIAKGLVNLLMRFDCFAQTSKYSAPAQYSAARIDKFRRGVHAVRLRTDYDVGKFIEHVPLWDEAKARIEKFYKSFEEKAQTSLKDSNRTEDGLVLDRVEKVEDIGIQEFWNLSVPQAENYLGSGGIFHKNSGKDHVCRVAAIRIAYLLQCLNDPQEYYNMPQQDSIHILNVASNSKQAGNAYFKPLKRILDKGWFADRCDVNQNSVEWGKGVEMISGHSDAESQEGLNIILGIADEIDAFKSDNDTRGGQRNHEYVNSAESIIHMIHSSATSRFPNNFKAVYISYPRYVGSPIMTRAAIGTEDIKENGSSSKYYVSGPYATWEVNPRVPDKKAFAEDYKKNPAKARTMYECKPSRAINPYFKNTEAIKACMRHRLSPLRPEYLLKTVEVIDPGTGEVRTADVWTPEFDFSELSPRAGAKYVIHADLAIKNDRAGIAMAHVADWKEIESIKVEDDGTENSYWENRPNVVVDFVFGFEADLATSPPREIQIRWYRQLVNDLRRMGFDIVQASHDGFGSQDSAQIMAAQGIKVAKLSTDVNDTIWKNFQDLMYEGRVSMPRSKILYEELTALQKMPNGKIDHPGGLNSPGKDLADATACASFAAVSVGGSESGDEEESGFDFTPIYPTGMSMPYGLKRALADKQDDDEFLF